jgi:hypothetical protein
MILGENFAGARMDGVAFLFITGTSRIDDDSIGQVVIGYHLPKHSFGHR